MSLRDEFVQSGYCRISGFLSRADAAGWLRRLDDVRDAFRAVGGKAGLFFTERSLEKRERLSVPAHRQYPEIVFRCRTVLL